MIDSGATAMFISKRFVERNHVLKCPLEDPIGLNNIDGTANRAGGITHFVRLTLTVGDITKETEFLVTDLGPEDLILGLPWLKETNPQVDWEKGEMKLPSGSEEEPSPPLQKVDTTRAQRRAWIKAGIITHATDQVYCLASFTYSTKLAADANEAKLKKTFEQMVPQEYHSHAKVFSEQESHRLPKAQPWDHTIDLKPDAPETLKSKVYPMPLNEQAALDEFIEENLQKGYIVPSKSPMASPVFFIKKKDGKLRLIQDYRKLNDITIKNRYPLPLASDIINRLKDAKIFTKFDVRWGYHNVRIKEGDEWKAAFVTNRGLFEPKVMFFGLTNSPATFQALMNSIFADLIAEGKVAVYLDDILIWSNDLAEHRKIVHEVLKRLEEHDLYLRPEKCEFEKSEIEYLGMLIREGQVLMDPVKTKAVTTWPTPQNLKDVRGFIGFANFYRRFIKDFSKICRPLHDLTKKDTPFVWGQKQQEAFDALKTAFTSDPILAVWDAERPTRIEVDASGHATGGVILQKSEAGLWHPLAFRSQTMTEPERNYEIYDREMLAIIEALKDWRHFLEGLPEPFEIWTDHANLKFWKEAQHLNRRQARWSLLLADFNFVLIHKPGTSMTQADPLTRLSANQISDSDDNKEQIVLKPEHFRTIAATAFATINPLEKKIRECLDREEEVAKALLTLKKDGPRKLQNGILEWESQDNLIYYKGKLYIPNNKDLRREIIKSCHDTVTTGHPGKHGTIELVSRSYWWPRLASDVEVYVQGCDACQRFKAAHHPNAVLQPQEVPEGPWKHMGIDLVGPLPLCKGYDMVAVYVDHYTDQCHIIPTTQKVNSEGVADMHYERIFPLHGFPEKVFSDRGPQFASRFIRALYARLGIETGFTTAYHPQGNGKTERKNQEVSQFLRIFSNQRQDDWVDHLPAAEFTLNSRIHSGAAHSPFELLYGFTPDFTIPAGKRSNIPALEKRLDNLMEARKDAEAALRISKARMKEQHEKGKRPAHVFEVGDYVWLDSKDLRIRQPTTKLGPKRLGPYKVLECVGELAYRLELPKSLKIHNVLSVSRLSPWFDDGTHKPPPPEPVQVDGEEEYEVDKILDSRFYRNQLQYLVSWKGYGAGENTWEPLWCFDSGKAKKAIQTFHKKHPAAPRHIAAATFVDLYPHFRAPVTSADPSVIPDQFPKSHDLAWEDGKYTGEASSSRGRSILGRG